jgi:hypothetical protein
MSNSRPSGFAGLRMGGKQTVESESYPSSLISVPKIRNGEGESSGWPNWRNTRDAVYTVQDRRKRIVRSRFPDKIVTKW